ncbi:hypothetical protein KM043_003176 [Ampulex compressa]|nr:hypothetical protein KM043_003176 [Ampulex compressa]
MLRHGKISRLALVGACLVFLCMMQHVCEASPNQKAAPALDLYRIKRADPSPSPSCPPSDSSGGLLTGLLGALTGTVTGLLHCVLELLTSLLKNLLSLNVPGVLKSVEGLLGCLLGTLGLGVSFNDGDGMLSIVNGVLQIPESLLKPVVNLIISLLHNVCSGVGQITGS